MGCKPDLPLDPTGSGLLYLRVIGDWAYTASEIRLQGAQTSATCEITGVRLTLDQYERGGGFFGKSSGGQMKCGGSLSGFSGSFAGYPIGTGYTYNQFIAFDFGAPDWRHQGFVTTTDSVRVDSISGTFILDNGGLVFAGKFRMVREPSQ
jgi:hypothetical protein